jgi:hypothetical protein
VDPHERGPPGGAEPGAQESAAQDDQRSTGKLRKSDGQFSSEVSKVSQVSSEVSSEVSSKVRLKFSKHASRTQRFLNSMEWEGQDGYRLITQILSKALVVNRMKAYVSII